MATQFRWMFVAAAAALAAVPAFAQALDARQVTTPQATVELIADVQRESSPFEVWVGLRFRLQEKWHIYWRNPGDSGGPPTVTWQLPDGVTAGAVVWPMPSRLPLGPLMNYGYEGDVVLPVRLTLNSQSRSMPSLPIRAAVTWLVCRESCLSGRASLVLTLPLVADEQSAADWSSRIDTARASEPKPAPATWRATARSGTEHFLLTVDTGQPRSSAFFFPLLESQIDDSSPQVMTTAGNAVQLRLRKSDQLVKDPASLKGVLDLGPGAHFEINAPVVVDSKRGK